MDDDNKSESIQEVEVPGTAKQVGELPYVRERTQFRALLAGNPNYFGNLKVSPFEPVVSIQGFTAYEAIGCVGFQPQFNRLEAVVYVYQQTGYGGDICSPGTPEYLRFYLSTDNGSTWQDLGLTHFTAYDIPGRRRLEYAVALDIAPQQRYCFIENLALVRAILSWNVPPPPNDPDFTPVWGNVHNTHIQVDPRRWIILGELLEAVGVKPVPQLAKVLDLAEPIPAAQPEPMTLAALAAKYKEQGVEPHRFALAELQKFISLPAFDDSLMAAGGKGLWPDLQIDWSKIGDLLNPVEPSTRYEQLECIGLDPNLSMLTGVIRVKLPSGYSGDLCSAGSREYVTFWADLDNNGTFETCLGTTSVTVHDIAHLPADGLEYAVFLPVDVGRLRRPCQEGPVVLHVRAILSWQVAPPCFNPNYVPVWGNRLETFVHIAPGSSPQPGTHYPIIQTAGSMDVGDISSISGLANGPAVLAGFTAQDSPFGGLLIITGHICNAPDISSGATKLKYRVEVSGDGGTTWQRVTNPFTLKRDQLLNGIWSDLPDITQGADADGWYEYQEDLTDGPGNAMIFPVGNVLARWNTGGLSGLWKLRIRAKNPSVVGPEWVSNVVTLEIDNTVPDAAITITSGGGACADFMIGDVIDGTYAATDLHFGSLHLRIVPGLGGSFTSPAPLPAGPTMPLTRSYAGGVSTWGESGTWSLDTSGMPRCGYVVYLDVWDRTIVDSGYVGRYAPAVVGLCLREAES